MPGVRASFYLPLLHAAVPPLLSGGLFAIVFPSQMPLLLSNAGADSSFFFFSNPDFASATLRLLLLQSEGLRLLYSGLEIFLQKNGLSYEKEFPHLVFDVSR